jgi:hypothetical protein
MPETNIVKIGDTVPINHGDDGFSIGGDGTLSGTVTSISGGLAVVHIQRQEEIEFVAAKVGHERVVKVTGLSCSASFPLDMLEGKTTKAQPPDTVQPAQLPPLTEGSGHGEDQGHL